MKTKFSELFESVSATDVGIQERIQAKLMDIFNERLLSIEEKEDYDKIDTDMFMADDEIFLFTEKMAKKLINLYNERIVLYRFNSYEYQKMMIDQIIAGECKDYRNINDFLDGYGDNYDENIHPKIKEEYDHIFNADNMGLI